MIKNMNINGYEIKPNADLRGADLADANLRYADLQGAILEGADLYRASLKGANLRGANLRGADLSYANLMEANLREANFRCANLKDAILNGAKIDLIPGHEELLKKVAEHALESENSLHMEKWHTCDTTHCIAGWATHLHPDGKQLEKQHGIEMAGLLLLGPEAHSHFFDSNKSAKVYLESVLR